MTIRRFGALVAASSALVAGCAKMDGTNAGLTNGPPPSGTEKAAGRSDLPGEIGSPASVPLAGTNDTETTAGTGGPGATALGSADPAHADPDSARANPPIRAGGAPNSAGGANTPTEPINTGTPRSPQ